jgi:hypothetical protein
MKCKYVAICAFLFSLLFSLPVLRDLSSISNYRDWDLLGALHWVPVYTVTHFRQFPFWNPYKCGGMPMLANPHSRILTPFFLLSLLFGPWVGLHLEIPGHLAIAWSGAHVLARWQRFGLLSSIICASIFAGSSWFPLHLAAGHTQFSWLGLLTMDRGIFLARRLVHQILPACDRRTTGRTDAI